MPPPGAIAGAVPPSPGDHAVSPTASALGAPSVGRLCPRVTVVIPCYNYGRFLVACVQSVLAQEAVDVDVLILDDASTDDSAQIASALAEADPRVGVIAHKRNIGHVPTFNEGLLRASGDYAVLLSADDLLTRRSLARATAVMEANPSVGLVYGHPHVVYGEEIGPARTRGRRTHVWHGQDWISAQCRRGLNCIHSPEACVRTSVQHAVGGYTPSLPHSGDLEMWLRIAAVADVARVNSDQAYRRIHGAGMMQTTFAGLLADLRGRREAYESFFAGAGARLPRAQRDLATARRRLSVEALDHACMRMREPEGDRDAAQAYVDFAREVLGASASTLPQWREYELLMTHAAGRRMATRSLHLGSSAVRRNLEGRYRWYRWRLTGV
jgi:Glycosyl transferase family 2